MKNVYIWSGALMHDKTHTIKPVSGHRVRNTKDQAMGSAVNFLKENYPNYEIHRIEIYEVKGWDMIRDTLGF